MELPGSAQKAKEVPTETAQRILRTKFWADPSFALVTGMERSVIYKESPLYRVETKYLRAVRLNLGPTLSHPYLPQQRRVPFHSHQSLDISVRISRFRPQRAGGGTL